MLPTSWYPVVSFMLFGLLNDAVYFVEGDQHAQSRTNPSQVIASLLEEDDLSEEMWRPLTPLLGQSHVQLQVLYEIHRESDFNSLTKFLDDASGVMVYPFQSSMGLLKKLFSLAFGPTILLVLCSLRTSISVFQTIHHKRLESHPVRFMLVLEDQESLEEFLISVEGKIYEGNYVVLIVKDRQMGSVTVFESRVGIDGVFRFIRLGKWKPFSLDWLNKVPHLFAGLDDPIPHSELSGRAMKVTAVNQLSQCHLGQLQPDGSTEALSGTDITLVETLGDALNFTHLVYMPPDKTYGNPLPNGSATGMVGMVSRRDVHFATCSLALSTRRETVVDFTYEYHRSPLVIFSRAPKQKISALAALSPFGLQVWLCIIASVLVIGPVTYTVSRLSSAPQQENQRTDMEWFFFNMFRSIVIQGNFIKSKNWSQRVILFTWFLNCMVISALYSGMLTAVLAIPSFETPIDYLSDLPDAVDNGFTIGVLGDSVDELLFKEAESGIYEQTWKLFNHEDRPQSFVSNNNVGMRRVMDGKFLYMGLKVICQIIATLLGKSKMHMSKEEFYPHGVAMACPPGAPYKKTFSTLTLRMTETGIMSKWRIDVANELSKQAPKDAESSRTYAITLTHLQAAFFVIVLGSAVALVVLFLEILFRRITNS